MKFCHGLIGAPPKDWNRLARACEAAGFDSVAVSDHVLFPATLESKYPYTPDGTPLFSPDEDWPGQLVRPRTFQKGELASVSAPGGCEKSLICLNNHFRNAASAWKK